MNVKLYDKWFNEIVERYLQKLTEGRFLFEAKLNKLVKEYVVIPENERDEDYHSNGGFFNKIESEKGKIGICYFINPDDPDIFIQFVIAHELAHLLFWNGNISFADYCEADDSYAISYVEREDSNGKYGLGLEECLADYMALVIICLIYPNLSKEEILQQLIDVEADSRIANGLIEITEKIIKLFDAEEQEIELHDPFDSIVLNKDNGKCYPKNIFLYSICTGYLSQAISDFDRLYGEGAWKRLNKKINKYIEDYEEKYLEKVREK